MNLGLGVRGFAIGLTIFAGSAFAEGDVAAGQKAFLKCKACHSVEASGKNGVGPKLHGLFGRKAGTVEGFKYSSAMTDSGITWDEKTLATYVADPKGAIPGNKMAFVGIKNATEMENLIAYLKEATR